jgi:hypothetical protein
MLDPLELFNAYRAPTQHLVSLLLAAAIWRWGGAPERWLIGVFVATMIAPVYIVPWLDPASGPIAPNEPIYVLIDVLAAGLFVGVALNANRNYPLWIAGFQLVAVAAHAVDALIDGVSPLAHAILAIGPSYGQLLLLIFGFVRHRARERRFGPYRAWRRSPPRGANWAGA